MTCSRTPTASGCASSGPRTWRQAQRVHNLTVSGIHTYYVAVGDAPVLVHNCKGAYDWKRNRSGVDDTPQDPIPVGSWMQRGESLAPNSSYHYVVMRSGSLRAMSDADLFAGGRLAGHTSLAGKKKVHMAGTFKTNSQGQVSHINEFSGHYRPREMPGYRGLESITREAFRKHGLPEPLSDAWKKDWNTP